MKVIPSLLAENVADFREMLRQAESMTDYVQIDIMDGIFVPSKSFPPEEINAAVTSVSFEVHLMVADPVHLVRIIHHRGLKRVLFHFESDVNHRDFVQMLDAKGLAAGMAVKPETTIAEFEGIVPLVSSLLFLAVDPGRYGSVFKPAVIEKIAAVRRLFPDKTISVDGGVSFENIEAIYGVGVDSVCVGSRIFLSGDPQDNYRRFLQKLNEIQSTVERE